MHRCQNLLSATSAAICIVYETQLIFESLCKSSWLFFQTYAQVSAMVRSHECNYSCWGQPTDVFETCANDPDGFSKHAEVPAIVFENLCKCSLLFFQHAHQCQRLLAATSPAIHALVGASDLLRRFANVPGSFRDMRTSVSIC